MAYQGLSLGDIYANAAQIKGAQQRSQLADLQLKQAQTDQAQTQGVNSLIASNPNATLPDLIKAGGMKGVAAAGDLGEARAKDSQFQLLQQLHGLQQQKFLTDQVVADPTKMPQVAQQLQSIGVQGHPDGWEHLPPAQIQANATKASQALDAQIQALTQQLVPPDKQFEAQQAVALENQKQLGPGGELKRKQLEIAAENSRNANTIAAENARSAATRATTMRGQDLEAARAGIPAGYERDPQNPGALRPIAGGPHDPNATAAGMDSRSAVMFNRVASSANEAVQAIKNIAELPITTSTGWFGNAEPGKGLFDSAKSVLAQKVTGQEAQDLKTMIAGVSRSLSTIETAGLAPNGSITHSMDSITIGEGDSQMTKLRKMAEMRQIVEKGIEPQLSNPKLGPAQRQLIQGIISQVQEAIPFTQHDITQLQRSKNPQATIMDFAKQSGLPTSTTPAPAATAPVKISSDADYAKLPSGSTYIAPDGSTRTKR